jgi:hypothetical protein
MFAAILMSKPLKFALNFINNVYFGYLLSEGKKPRFDFAHLAEAVSRDLEEDDEHRSRDAQIVSHVTSFIQERIR